MTEKDIIKSFETFFTANTGIPTLLDPQRIETPKPVFRLALNGVAAQGKNRVEIVLQGVLSASGEGPEMFLGGVIDSVLAMLFFTDPTGQETYDYTVTDGTTSFTAKATVRRNNPGSFQANDEEESKYPFSWVEMYTVRLSYNPKHLV